MALWKQILRTNFTNVDKLLDFLEIEDRSRILKRSPFTLSVPYRLAAKMEKGNIDDPLFKQFVPLADENNFTPGFELDAVHDLESKKTGKLLQKYPTRSLILTTSACAMHCRYCFRRHFPYETAPTDFADELKQIEDDPTIEEVILSGGDPLSLSDEKLEALLLKLNQIETVKRIRFHTRFVVGIPERIDESLLSVLAKSQKQIWFILHINHPKELDEELFSRLDLIRKLGIPLLNQAVLLKGINDHVEILEELFSTLVNRGCQPYYLHQLDQVQGASHFEVPVEKGMALIEELTERLSGYAVPKYVKEVPGQRSKLPVASLYVERSS